jgi:rare lipoprotein A
LRPTLKLGILRPAYVTIAAILLVLPASAAALSTAATAGVPAHTTAPAPMKVSVKPRRIAYGHDVTVTGVAPPTEVGRTLLLDLAPTQGARWRTLAATKVGPSGRFQFTVRLRRSGFVKVVDAAAAYAQAASSTAFTALRPVPASSPQQVAVAAAFGVPSQSFDVLGGQSITVHGTLLPSGGARPIALQSRSGGRWRTLTSTLTGPRGGFHLRYVPGGAGGPAGGQPLRVLFWGDRANTRATRGVGKITVYNQSVASWYNDGGSTACGFHATFGVANRSLPCGTQVTFRYGSRSVTAVVDDRGPFVGGREWDLNQNTAAALGFSGVDTVWSTMG